ncbi:unnamed protein product, partial [Ceratitis capitata]
RRHNRHAIADRVHIQKAIVAAELIKRSFANRQTQGDGAPMHISNSAAPSRATTLHNTTQRSVASYSDCGQ